MLGNAFQPATLGQVTISVAATSSFTAVPGNGDCLQIYNSGTTVLVFIESCGGSNGVTAATVAGSYCVPPGANVVIARHPGDTGISAIGSAAGPTNLYVSAGVQT